LIFLIKKELKRKFTEVRLPKNMQNTLKSRPMFYRPPILLPELYLPLPRRDKNLMFPRTPSAFAYLTEPPSSLAENKNLKSIRRAKTQRNYHPTQLVNQQNLKEMTRLKLYTPPAKPLPPSVPDYGEVIQKK
jgi:hypothetical protein